MSARDPWDEDAGPWVAYRDEPKRRKVPGSKPARYETVHGETTRIYLYDPTTGTGSTSAGRGTVRFDTKAEALAAARARWPRRVVGCRIGAEKVNPICLTCGWLLDWNADQWACTNEECGDEWHPDGKRLAVTR